MMKTAEEWLALVHEKPFLLDSENRNWIRAIQLDALKEAAEIADRIALQDCEAGDACEIRDAILARVRELK